MVLVHVKIFTWVPFLGHTLSTVSYRSRLFNLPRRAVEFCLSGRQTRTLARQVESRLLAFPAGPGIRPIDLSVNLLTGRGAE
ncbi:uncharacterized protein BDR25DRAFT_355472 [Lindgomyces ingoldianus]|uniref:Uncharacterized protein n=1 Tax=Lindgomyces ingoldianus TaxID=673940 RepID=A0ACB6QU21_9PLEO|nr:uncharacterized protein BDR25DRAFT_355472 [Lindgomyces ingoldianus]KAF2470357.1 hypothetical protein BDR25DRAFT_355472 [Lindgomyces ingoldianus]